MCTNRRGCLLMTELLTSTTTTTQLPAVSRRLLSLRPSPPLLPLLPLPLQPATTTQFPAVPRRLLSLRPSPPLHPLLPLPFHTLPCHPSHVHVPALSSHPFHCRPLSHTFPCHPSHVHASALTSRLRLPSLYLTSGASLALSSQSAPPVSLLSYLYGQIFPAVY